MGFWNLVDVVIHWFENALDKWYLYYALIIVGALFLGFIIGGGAYLIVKSREHPSAPNPEQVFIEQNALSYCMNLSFNSWRWKDNTSLQFECYNEEEKVKSIEKYLNMS